MEQHRENIVIVNPQQLEETNNNILEIWGEKTLNEKTSNEAPNSKRNWRGNTDLLQTFPEVSSQYSSSNTTE